MKSYTYDSSNEWIQPPGSNKNRPLWKRLITHRLTGLGAVFLFGLLIYVTDAATWAIRLTLGTLFCSLIYARDTSPSGRWLAIGIIAVGTMLSILAPLFGNALNVLLQ
jgi:hypothetical protein